MHISDKTTTLMERKLHTQQKIQTKMIIKSNTKVHATRPTDRAVLPSNSIREGRRDDVEPARKKGDENGRGAKGLGERDERAHEKKKTQQLTNWVGRFGDYSDCGVRFSTHHSDSSSRIVPSVAVPYR